MAAKRRYTLFSREICACFLSESKFSVGGCPYKSSLTRLMSCKNGNSLVSSADTAVHYTCTSQPSARIRQAPPTGAVASVRPLRSYSNRLPFCRSGHLSTSPSPTCIAVLTISIYNTGIILIQGSTQHLEAFDNLFSVIKGTLSSLQLPTAPPHPIYL